MSEFTLKQQIQCVEREIAMRERVYPNWIAAKKLKQEKADYEINCMKQVQFTLENLNRTLEEYTK